MNQEGGDWGHKIMVDKEDESYYPHYLRETILIYQGCNLVAEVIKNEYGDTIYTKRMHHNQHHHHHPAIPNNYSFEDQEKGNRHVKKNNLDQEQVARNPSDHHPASALKINFIFPGKDEQSQTVIIPKGKRTIRRVNTVDKNPNQEHDPHLPNQENLGFLVNQPLVNINVNNNEGDDGFVLFVEKELTKTDDSDNHQRFSISRNKVNDDRFLTKEELLLMKNKGAVNAVLTDPCGVKYDVKLMIEITGKNCECYKIVKPWNLIRHNNNIHQGAVIQLWASRSNYIGSDLCFHLVRKN